MTEDIVKVRWLDAQRLELGIIQKHPFRKLYLFLSSSGYVAPCVEVADFIEFNIVV